MGNAVVFLEGSNKPVLELAAEEFVFPITIKERTTPILFHMKRYRSYPVKAFYDALLVRAKRLNRGEKVYERSHSEDLGKFIESHFVKMERVAVGDEAPTIEQQRTWLSIQREDTMRLIFGQSYNAISAPEFAETNGHKPMQLFGPEQLEIDSQWTLHGDGVDHRLIVTHHSARLTKLEHDKYQKAIRVVEHDREQYQQANWDVIEHLYDQKIRSLTGAVISGQPCTAENAKEWVPLVPFCMKVFVMGQIGEELETKNA